MAAPTTSYVVVVVTSASTSVTSKLNSVSDVRTMLLTVRSEVAGNVPLRASAPLIA